VCATAALALALAMPLSAPAGARADGSGLLDLPASESQQAGLREAHEAMRHQMKPADLPDAVTEAAQLAVPGLIVGEAYVVRHRPLTSRRVLTEYSLKGHDAGGRTVLVHTGEDGSEPMVTRVVPIRNVPDEVLAEARPYASRHLYRLTGALVVTRSERFLGRTSRHTAYYLKGNHRDRPDVERFVWYSSSGRFRLRDLDDVLWKAMQTD
jgi:hypothetical protein